MFDKLAIEAQPDVRSLTISKHSSFEHTNSEVTTPANMSNRPVCLDTNLDYANQGGRKE